MEINLIPYRKEAELPTNLIIRIWQEHNHFTPSYKDTEFAHHYALKKRNYYLLKIDRYCIIK